MRAMIKCNERMQEGKEQRVGGESNCQRTPCNDATAVMTRVRENCGTTRRGASQRITYHIGHKNLFRRGRAEGSRQVRNCAARAGSRRVEVGARRRWRAWIGGTGGRRQAMTARSNAEQRRRRRAEAGSVAGRKRPGIRQWAAPAVFRIPASNRPPKVRWYCMSLRAVP